MKSTMNIKMTVVMLTAIFTIPMVPLAQGADLEFNKKAVPGNMCLVREAYAQYFYDKHAIRNYAVQPIDPNTKLPANVYVTCPIMRDHMSSDWGIDRVDVYVDGFPGEHLYCQLEVLRPKDDALGYESKYMAFNLTPTTDSEG